MRKVIRQETSGRLLPINVKKEKNTPQLFKHKNQLLKQLFL